MRKGILIYFVFMFLLACSPAPSEEIAPEQEQEKETEVLSTFVPTESQPSDVKETPLMPTNTAGADVEASPAPGKSFEPYIGDPLPVVQGSLFSSSGVCTICHQRNMSASGEDVDIGEFWRGTMMANAARDPYWLANVQAETVKAPALSDVIENKCSTCHMPMAHVTAKTEGASQVIFGDGFLNDGHELHDLAMDGVSCTVCHQIRADNLGKDESFSGGFVIDTKTPAGNRVIYGPFDIEQKPNEIMRSGSGFTTVASEHIQQSELCASCHTLYTPYLDAQSGEVAGVFPEQTPYLEWLASDYGAQTSCQDCHMPVADGAVKLSVVGGKPRTPFSKHAFVGGNTFVLGVLRDHGLEMGVTAGSEQFEETMQRAKVLLGDSVSLAINDAEVTSDSIVFEIVLASNVGHKFPSGFPSRRAWLHVVVKDSDGEVVFESGEYTPDGKIVEDDNDISPERYEPHYDQIDSPEQVQIYQSILADTNGKVTTTLLQGSHYVKDNRLLPVGFDKTQVMDDIAVYGEALYDDNFTGGMDTVTYDVPIVDAKAPFTIEVSLLYQAVSYRWVENLRQTEGGEIARFLGYYDASSNHPVVVQRIVQSVSP